MPSRERESRGFTLIELLVVIAIIGILSSVVLASLNSARQKGRDARRVSDMKQIALALELYYDAQAQTYPAAASTAALEGAGSPTFVPTYISTMPLDPQGTTPYNYQSLDSADAACGSEPCPSYVAWATLEGTKPSGAFETDITGVVDCSEAATYCIRP